MPFDIDEESEYRSNSPFNDWLDTQYGEFEISNDIVFFSQSASAILFEMDRVGYRAALEAFQSDQLNELKRSILDYFPLPIAYHFHKVEKGYENQIQRLHSLRDIWEAQIFTLYALVVGECRFLEVPLGSSSINSGKLYSDRLHQKLEVMKAFRDAATEQGYTLVSTELFDDHLLERIRNLNRVRNEFSHTAAISESQARRYYTEHSSEVFSILGELVGLENVTVMRFVGPTDSIQTIRCEVFRGSRMVREYEELELQPDQVERFHPCLHSRNVIVKHGDLIYSLAPFLHFKEDASGHNTRLCFYKTKRNHEFTFEIVGNSEQFTLNQDAFAIEVEQMRDLLARR